MRCLRLRLHFAVIAAVSTRWLFRVIYRLTAADYTGASSGKLLNFSGWSFRQRNNSKKKEEQVDQHSTSEPINKLFVPEKQIVQETEIHQDYHQLQASKVAEDRAEKETNTRWERNSFVPLEASINVYYVAESRVPEVAEFLINLGLINP